MKVTRLLAGVVLLVCALSMACSKKEETTISHAQLVEMFDNIAKNSDWDMSKPMRWGYFFTDTDRKKLEQISPLLEKEGYKVVEIYRGKSEGTAQDKSQDKSEDKSQVELWWLHVEKVEIHNPDSLHQRNQILEGFAADHDLQSYDGMDVNPTETKR